MQNNTFSTKQDLHFSEVLNYWFDSFKYFTNKNRFCFPFFDSPQMEMAYHENYYTIQERMEFIKGFKAFDEINKFIKITFNGEKSRCEGFLAELRQSVEGLEFSKTECWLKSMIEDFENENTQFDSDIAPPATYQMMHELYYLWNDAVSDCNKIFALYSNLPSVLPPQLFNQVNTPPQAVEEIIDKVNGLECAEFNNLFGADIERKNEVWQYMKLLGMIDNEGTYLPIGETAIIRAFVMVMKKNGKFAPTAEEGFLIRIVGLKLLGNNKLRVRKSKQIEDKQREIVRFLNNQETKINSFEDVD